MLNEFNTQSFKAKMVLNENKDCTHNQSITDYFKRAIENVIPQNKIQKNEQSSTSATHQ